MWLLIIHTLTPTLCVTNDSIVSFVGLPTLTSWRTGWEGFVFTLFVNVYKPPCTSTLDPEPRRWWVTTKHNHLTGVKFLSVKHWKYFILYQVKITSNKVKEKEGELPSFPPSFTICCHAWKNLDILFGLETPNWRWTSISFLAVLSSLLVLYPLISGTCCNQSFWRGAVLSRLFVCL